MQDGKSFSALNDVDMGRGLKNPMSDLELWEKFEDCAQHGLEEHAIRPLFDQLQSLEKVENLREVTSMMLHPRAHGKSIAAE